MWKTIDTHVTCMCISESMVVLSFHIATFPCTRLANFPKPIDGFSMCGLGGAAPPEIVEATPLPVLLSLLILSSANSGHPVLLEYHQIQCCGWQRCWGAAGRGYLQINCNQVIPGYGICPNIGHPRYVDCPQCNL